MAHGNPFEPSLNAYLKPCLAGAELFRRAMWSCLRLEVEYIETNNINALPGAGGGGGGGGGGGEARAPSLATAPETPEQQHSALSSASLGWLRNSIVLIEVTTILVGVSFVVLSVFSFAFAGSKGSQPLQPP